MVIIMNPLHQQFLNEYRLTAQLIIDKKKYQEMLLDEYGTIDKKLQRMGFTGLKNYLSSIDSENISEEEKEKKILAQGKKWFGGLKESERIYMLELYFHSKGRLRQNSINGKVSKFHEIIIKLVSIIMQSNVWIKKELSTHPNIKLLQSLAFIFPKIDSYRESLKLQDYYLAKLNIELLLIEIQKEKKINLEIDEYLIKVIQQYNNKIIDIKQSVISGLGLDKDVSYLLKTGILTLLMICVLYTNISAKAGDEKSKKVDKEKIEIITSFIPVFPTSTDYRITALFGSRIISKGSKNHRGIDIGCPSGTEVYAIESGTIEIRRDNGYGLYVVITHSNGVKSLYAHGRKVPSNIKSGMIVNKGELIMYSGNSGASKGPHLHFEIILDGQKIDPLQMYTDMLNVLKFKTETISWAQKDSYQRLLGMKK